MLNNITNQSVTIWNPSNGLNNPVRNVVRRTTRRVVGYHASRKMDGLIGWESQTENLYFEWLEVDPDILRFYAQPVRIRFDGGHYTPDVRVVSRTGEYFVEIKPDSVLDDDETMARIRALQAHFKAFGSELRLITKSELMREPLRLNVQWLRRISQRSLSEEYAWLALKYFEGSPCTVEELNSRIGASPDNWLVLNAVILGLVYIDLSKPIDGNSLVTPYEGAVS